MTFLDVIPTGLIAMIVETDGNTAGMLMKEEIVFQAIKEVLICLVQLVIATSVTSRSSCLFLACIYFNVLSRDDPHLKHA